MVPEQSRGIRLLFRIAAFRASEAELGDLLEEYAGGKRSALWLIRQILSTSRTPRFPLTMHEGRTEMLANIWSDIRYAARMLRRNPGFAAAAVAPIALGIGINTGLFSVLNSVAFRPLPTPDSHELVSVHQEFRGVRERRVHGARSMFSTPEYRVYRRRTQTLENLMAYSRPWTATLGGSSPREIEGVLVTCNYFDVLRVRPVIGTGFTAANCDASDATPAVILTHRLWSRAFAADRDILHQAITLNGRSVGVVGVAPPDFEGIDITKVDFFAPTSVQAVLQPQAPFHEDPHMSWLTLIGRRNQGVEMAEVRAELAVIAGEIDQRQPGRTTALTVAPATALSLPVARRDILSIAAVVLAAFGFVLLIACANVANLLLARAAGRTREIAVRLSVGASRGRLIQQLLTESALIALAGGLVGCLTAWWSFQGLLAWLLSSVPGTIPPLSVDAHPDLTVLWVALALTATTALAFGLVPAVQASRQDLQTAVKAEGGAARRRGGWLRGSLVGLQVAVCTVLLVSAGLLFRALYASHAIEPGFEYRNIAVVSVDLRGPGYDEQKVAAFRQQMAERVGSVPGVDAVAHVSKVPLSPGRHQSMFRRPGEEQWHEVDVNRVSPAYFSLIAVPIVRGRTFTPAELRRDSRAVIVTEATARRYWPGDDPVGRTLLMSLGPKKEDVPLEIVGVAKDARVSELAETPSSYLYVPAAPGDQRRLSLLVRSGREFAALAPDVRAVGRQLEPGAVVRVNRLEENLEFWRAGSRLIASLSGSLGMLALVLASSGVYGVVSYVVSRRRREVGIRKALGATARDVQVLILRQTLRPVLVGILVGLCAAAAVSQVLESVLFGISPFDAVTFIGAPLILLGAAATASLSPTRQALQVDPMIALRYE